MSIAMPELKIKSVLVVGAESVGKSALIAAMTGRAPYSLNFRGSTVSVQIYSVGDTEFVDTPGILFQSDADATRRTLDRLDIHGDQVLAVVKASQLDAELRDLLPLLVGGRGAVVVTYWDKVDAGDRASDALTRLSRECGVPFVPVDARSLEMEQREAILDALDADAEFQRSRLVQQAGWQIEPKRGPLEWRFIGPCFALGLLLLPSLVAVQFANAAAGMMDPFCSATLAPVVKLTQDTLPPILAALLAGKYGLLTMGPLLFAWAAPTVLIYAALLAIYKASGLIDRVTLALQSLTRPIGLTGRDIVRVLMGMGCNVPAVISTRNCSSCTRGACLHTIGFGAACSYQFGATIGVFAAVQRPWLVWPYLAYLTVTTLIYTRLVSDTSARSPLNLLTLEKRSFLSWPRLREVWREMRDMVREFFLRSLPIFLAITFVTSLLDWYGVVGLVSGQLQPLMSLFRLPGEASLPLVMAALRKDGLLLFAEQTSIATLSSVQILTGVYLAGVLVPCLVTVWTIAREQSWRFALRLVARQLVAAVVFSCLLAWVGAAICG